MRRYAGTRYCRVWRAAAAALAGVGVVTALVFVAPGPNLAAFLFAAFSAGAVWMSLAMSSARPSDEVLRAALRWAALGGGLAVATLGYAVAVGGEVLLLLLLVAGTSPPVVGWIGWLQETPDTEAPSRVAAPPLTAVPELETAELEGTELDSAAPLSEMTAAELCLAWRRSFTELKRSEHWSATIDVRRAYLDELERRFPEEFAAWMASGPRAASDPGRFFNHGADHSGG